LRYDWYSGLIIVMCMIIWCVEFFVYNDLLMIYDIWYYMYLKIWYVYVDMNDKDDVSIDNLLLIQLI